MIKNPQELLNLNNSGVETALRLARISLESSERLFRLQLETAKQALESSAQNIKAFTTVKDPQEAVGLQSKLTETSIENSLNYSRSMYEIASQTQSQFNQLLEEQVNEFNKNIVNTVDSAVKSSPAGTEVATSAFKSTVAATAAAIDSMTKAAKQVADFADASVKAATTATVDAVRNAAQKAS